VPTVTREHILEKLNAFANSTAGRITLHKFSLGSGIPIHNLYHHFPDGWYALLDLAGLQHRAGRVRPRSDHQLMTEFHRIAADLRRAPRSGDLKSRGRYQPYDYENRYGSWNNIELAYRAWCNNRGLTPIPAAGQPAATLEPPPAPAPLRPDADSSACIGTPLAPLGLTYAPTNELGVVHVFGMFSQALGFVVEQITGRGFPDCIALRQAGPHRWRRLRVEFEYKSSNFAAHNHNPALCDLIVCWDHDWHACPLEVIELKSLLLPSPNPLNPHPAPPHPPTLPSMP
jgi:hypothetical protein